MSTNYTPSNRTITGVQRELSDRFQPNGFNNLGSPSPSAPAPEIQSAGFSDVVPLLAAAPQIASDLTTSLSNRFGDQHQSWSSSPADFSQQIQQTQDLLNGGNIIGNQLGPTGGALSSIGSGLFNFLTARPTDHGLEGDLTYANRTLDETRQDQELMQIKAREGEARIRAEKALDAETHQIQGQTAMIGHTGPARDYAQAQLIRQATTDRIATDPNLHQAGNLQAPLNQSGADFQKAQTSLAARTQQQAVIDAEARANNYFSDSQVAHRVMSGDRQGAEQDQLTDQLSNERKEFVSSLPPGMRPGYLHEFDTGAKTQVDLLSQHQTQDQNLSTADTHFADTQSQSRITDARSQAAEDSLRANGQTYAADTALFKRQQDDKITSLQSAARHEREISDAITLDNDQKRQHLLQAQQLDREATADAETNASEDKSRRIQHDRDDELAASDAIKQTNIARLRSEGNEYAALLAQIDLRYDGEIEKAQESSDTKTVAALSAAKSQAQTDAAGVTQQNIDDTNLKARSIALRAEHRVPEAALMENQAEFKKYWDASDKDKITSNYAARINATPDSATATELKLESQQDLAQAPAARNAAINLERAQLDNFLRNEPAGAGSMQARSQAIAFRTILDDSQHQPRNASQFAELGHSLRVLNLDSQRDKWKTDAQLGKENASSLEAVMEKAMQKLIDGPKILVLAD